jgi:hypothetical protein
MSIRYEFTAQADPNGMIRLPEEIASRIRLKGIERLHIVVTSVSDQLDELGLRGIDAELIDQVAAQQTFDRDIAVTVLRGEGSAAGTPLGQRLLALLPDQPGALQR